MDALATVVLRRAGVVVLPAPAAEPAADGAAWVSAFEADLAARGWLLAAPLRDRFARLDASARVRWADWVCAVADETVGADRDHVPLFRSFPDTPEAPEALFVDRLLVHLFQADAAPCVLCGTSGSVRPLDPCGHLVCVECFDPALYSACAVCGRRLTSISPYVLVTEPNPEAGPVGKPLRLRRITLDEAPEATATRLRDELVARTTALGAADLADLMILVAATAPGRLDWLPEQVPARETSAVVTAWALHATTLTDAYAQVVGEAAARWTTVTDVARVLWAYSGGDVGLVLPRKPGVDGPLEAYRPVQEPRLTVDVPKVRALPRPLRRAVLAFLDALDPATAAEDMSRHPVVWKRLAERLHPYEHVGAYPQAAVVFATLRGTRALATGPLGLAIADVAAPRPERFVLAYHRGGTVSVRVRTFAALVEDAVAAADVAAAATLLAQRPGDLWRRADHLLRLADDDPAAQRTVVDALARTAARVSPNVLATAAASLNGRDAAAPHGRAAAVAAAVLPESASIAEAVAVTEAAETGVIGAALRRALRLAVRTPARAARPAAARGPEPGTPRRTFFPKGDVVRTWTVPEQRVPLPVDAIAQVRAITDTELVIRAAELARYDVAVLDAALAAIPAPTRERAGSAQLAGWPRGSVRTLAEADVLRLFLHWVDSAGHRVDLDLSCGFYDENWTPVGHCDYTRLRFKHTAAIHSGDLTSAPAPLGATEYLDLNRAALANAGVRWAVPVVLSFNDVPFELLDAAFAGFSVPVKGSRRFDAGRVMQKFGLRGDAKTLAPLVLNVATGEVMWIDASLSTKGYGHSVGAHGARLGRLAADLWEHFRDGGRASLLDVAAWHAVARADRIHVVHADGTATPVMADDPVSAVAAIRAAAAAASGDAAVDAVGRVFAATEDEGRLSTIVGGDVAQGSAALLVDGDPGASWTRVTAADLMAGLAPLT
ncbi:MXAN_6230/SCO0854 family RING domain-containing protein [Catellatospora citrea]|uniref:RING finger family protein n=1 Tax=Catellatospora citrea TaxID=53366 RepID=A0A8J3NYX5_9ACTN|nr:MXAN_6230/SCO0854 family RING domain-containing protein [Catellatospora citrea]RKE05850.1 RING finger family protein [Catellatospora citrea]GIF97211.1 hypothetical protein Cci01nite_23050 [Catellatospora citrea]